MVGNWEGRGGEYLTALRWPRSSGGSLRSLTASITPERRSAIFGEDEEDEDEAHLDTPRPTVRPQHEASYQINGDNAAALATRVAMARRNWEREREGGLGSRGHDPWAWAYFYPYDVAKFGPLIPAKVSLDLRVDFEGLFGLLLIALLLLESLVTLLYII